MSFRDEITISWDCCLLQEGQPCRSAVSELPQCVGHAGKMDSHRLTNMHCMFMIKEPDFHKSMLETSWSFGHVTLLWPWTISKGVLRSRSLSGLIFWGGVLRKYSNIFFITELNVQYANDFWENWSHDAGGLGFHISRVKSPGTLPGWG